MAAATTTKTSPASSKLNHLIDLAKVVPAIREDTIKMAHVLISNAKSMADLGYSEKIYNEIPDVKNNYGFTVKILKSDEGLCAHLLNKVSKLIRDGVLSNEDHLCIMDWPRKWVFGDMYPMFNNTVLLDGQAISAVVNYANLMMGNID